MSSKFAFDKKANAWSALCERALGEIGRTSNQYFVKSFGGQSFDGKKWGEVQRRIPNTPTYKRSSTHLRTSPILINTGKLLQAQYEAVKSISNNTLVMQNNAPYSGYMNDGTPHVMARPFMRHTMQLQKMQLRILKAVTGEVWTKA